MEIMLSREEARNALTGPIMSLHTPFHADGEIDYEGVRRMIDFTIDAGTKSVIMTYGNSLYTLLTDQEVAELTKAVVEHTGGRAMVVAADRQWSTGKEVEFARYAREVGADMLMVLPPDWAASCTVDTFVEHYAAVAEHIPVMVVTGPFGLRPLPLSLEVIRRLRDEVDRIYAVKDDVCEEFGRRLGLLVHDRWAVFASGTKRVLLNALPYGCDGHMSTFIHFRPSLAHAFWDAIDANEMSVARKMIEDWDVPFGDFLASFPGGRDAVKHGIFELSGLAQRWRRRPYYSLSDAEMERVASFLKEMGWL